MSGTPADLGRLLVVLGPTASGKSALGIELARRLGGEVLLCDSTQVFRHFDIGTAKTPVREQQGVPHHLTDLVEPDQLFTAGEYRRRALGVLADLETRRKLPILTAGTGLYLRALLEGLAEAPERSEDLRRRLDRKADRRGAEYLHRLLTRLDAEAAARIARRDRQKVIRAIEIRVLAKKSVGEVHRAGRDALQGYEITKIGLAPARSALYLRIKERTGSMIARGWVGEVRDLLAAGVLPNAKPFEFIGYSELRDHLAGKIGLDEAVRRIEQSTRQFAKRQMTWFRREKDVHWLAGFGDDANIQNQALEIAENRRH
jgi:tRNA dimethylallyltransferase